MKDQLIIIFIACCWNCKVSGQTNVSKLLTEHSWIMCNNSLLVPDSLSDEEIEECRHEYIFKKDGIIEYVDRARNYDPHDREKGCSNNFLGYTGKWVNWKGIVFITLNYNTISEEKYIVYKYRVNYISKSELSLVYISDGTNK